MSELFKVDELMRQYFQNRNERKQIKIERIEYLTNNKCKIKGETLYDPDEGYAQSDDCIHEAMNVDKYCDACKKRHGFYLRLKKIRHANSGIMNRVRRLVKPA